VSTRSEAHQELNAFRRKQGRGDLTIFPHIYSVSDSLISDPDPDMLLNWDPNQRHFAESGSESRHFAEFGFGSRHFAESGSESRLLMWI
jgi:hypothetical protein